MEFEAEELEYAIRAWANAFASIAEGNSAASASKKSEKRGNSKAAKAKKKGDGHPESTSVAQDVFVHVPEGYARYCADMMAEAEAVFNKTTPPKRGAETLRFLPRVYRPLPSPPALAQESTVVRVGGMAYNDSLVTDSPSGQLKYIKTLQEQALAEKLQSIQGTDEPKKGDKKAEKGDKQAEKRDKNDVKGKQKGKDAPAKAKGDKGGAGSQSPAGKKNAKGGAASKSSPKQSPAGKSPKQSVTSPSPGSGGSKKKGKGGGKSKGGGKEPKTPPLPPHVPHISVTQSSPRWGPMVTSDRLEGKDTPVPRPSKRSQQHAMHEMDLAP